MVKCYERALDVALGKLVGEMTVKSCGWLAARLKMRSAANVSQTLSRTVWKNLFKSLSRTLAEHVAKERNVNEFAP